MHGVCNALKSRLSALVVVDDTLPYPPGASSKAVTSSSFVGL